MMAVSIHLELGRELHRKITRLLAAQDAIHMLAGLGWTDGRNVRMEACGSGYIGLWH
jgi:hypothetical protein